VNVGGTGNGTENFLTLLLNERERKEIRISTLLRKPAQCIAVCVGVRGIIMARMKKLRYKIQRNLCIFVNIHTQQFSILIMPKLFALMMIYAFFEK
jgi:hypothetical protein